MLLWTNAFHFSVNAEFAHLLKQLWSSRPGFLDGGVSPIKFKDRIAEFESRFVGFRLAFSLLFAYTECTYNMATWFHTL